jgi:CelD/BcsL family acetyltransferase involved in cellulose biosynthesis
MKLEIIRSDDEFSALAEEWNRLLETSITNTPFLRHEYQLAWWQHRGGGEWPDSELHIILGHENDGTLKGIAPLFLSKNHTGETHLLLIGSVEISDFLDVIAAEDDLQPFLDAVLTYISGPDAPVWESLDLYNLIEGTKTLSGLEAAAEKQGLKYQQERIQPAPYIRLPDDFDEYMASLDKKYRHELRRKMRNAAGHFIPVNWYVVEDPESLEAEVDEFIDMMREEDEKDRFLSDEMVAQLHTITQAGMQHGWLHLAFLKVGKEKAAGYLNFDYGDQLWVYNSCLRRKFSNLSPGIVLMGHLLIDAIEKGREGLDMMRGDENYKYQLGGKDRFVVRALITK